MKNKSTHTYTYTCISNMSGSHLRCWWMAFLQWVRELKRRCGTSELLNIRQTCDDFSESQSLLLHFIIFSVACSSLFCFSVLFYPDVSLFSILMSSFYIFPGFSFYCVFIFFFSYSLYTPAQSFTQFKDSIVATFYLYVND